MSAGSIAANFVLGNNYPPGLWQYESLYESQYEPLLI